MDAEIVVALIGAAGTVVSTAMTVAASRRGAPSYRPPGGTTVGSPVGRVFGALALFAVSVFAMYVLATQCFDMIYVPAHRNIFDVVTIVLSATACAVTAYIAAALVRRVGRPFPGRIGLLVLVALFGYGSTTAFVATSYVI